jgi:hypothetical protein
MQDLEGFESAEELENVVEEVTLMLVPVDMQMTKIGRSIGDGCERIQTSKRRLDKNNSGIGAKLEHGTECLVY